MPGDFHVGLGASAVSPLGFLVFIIHSSNLQAEDSDTRPTPAAPGKSSDHSGSPGTSSIVRGRRRDHSRPALTVTYLAVPSFPRAL